MEFDPVRAEQAAADIEELADRLAAELAENTPVLQVQSPAMDEVSTQAAQTLRDVADDYGRNATAGVQELRALALALRAQSHGLSSMDADNAADFTAVR